jgi:hypothetical protein
MTRTEQRFIDRAIRKISPQLVGAPADFIQKFVTDAIREAISDAADEEAGRSGVDVGELEPGRLPQPPVAQPSGPMQWGKSNSLIMPDADPETRPKTEIIPVQPKSLLLIPGQEGFASAQAGKPRVGVDEVLRVWRDPKPGKRLKQGVYQERWQRAISELVGLINGHMPPSIAITPVGAELRLNIARTNVLSDVVSGNVKVEYGLPGQSTSKPSQRNPGGGSLDPMPIDRVVHSMFNIKDKTVNWEQRISDVVAQAEDVFRPRSAVIENRTPAKTGPIEMLMAGDPRRNAGGYGIVGGDPGSIDPRSEAGGQLILNTEDAPAPKKRPGIIVPNL